MLFRSVLVDGQLGAGPQTVTWTAPSAPGLYVATVEAGARVATTRLTRLPR